MINSLINNYDSFYFVVKKISTINFGDKFQRKVLLSKTRNYLKTCSPKELTLTLFEKSTQPPNELTFVKTT
jgi:hypothetical protein